MTNFDEIKFKKFLNLFWLRPEQAIVTFMKSEAFKDLKFESPSLDLSCGDGMFMFLHLGGEFNEDFDYYESTSSKQFSHDKVIDIFDHCDDTYGVRVTKQPEIKIDYATDLKDGMVKKAEKSGIYNKVLLHDNNDLPLPFEDNYFKTIYSNSIYFVKDMDGMLQELRRIVKPDGSIVLAVLTPYLHETFDQLKRFMSPEAMKILEREERTLMPGMRTHEEWVKTIKNNGFEIVEEKPIYHNKLLVDIYNVGFRPIGHLLIQMSRAMSIEERLEVKQEWTKIFNELLKPILSLPNTMTLEKAPYLHFKIKKSV